MPKFYAYRDSYTYYTYFNSNLANTWLYVCVFWNIVLPCEMSYYCSMKILYKWNVDFVTIITTFCLMSSLEGSIWFYCFCFYFLSWKYYPALSKVTNRYLGDSKAKSTSDPSRILGSWVSDLILAAHSSKALPLLFPQHLLWSHGLSVLLMSCQSVWDWKEKAEKGCLQHRWSCLFIFCVHGLVVQKC